MNRNTPLVLFESYRSGERSFFFDDFTEEVCARRFEEVAPALERVEEAVERGFHAAGFVSYEAAQGLSAELSVKRESVFPLVWFGIFRKRRELRAGEFRSTGSFELSQWRRAVDEEEYCGLVEEVREEIADGQTYQVNLSFRCRANFKGDALSLYNQLCRSQQAAYCAYIKLDDFHIVSASPELFFKWEGDTLITRPMKGTGRRGRTMHEDGAIAAELLSSEKERAENLMIVDLLRNDMGRISQIGSVSVPRLLEVETYPTLLQMTSTVSSRLLPGVGLVDVFQALFPCGSVTGAPKIRTMQLIEQLEDEPRGIYTGAIGYLSPGREAVFNVAIRTICIDKSSGDAELSIGSGITYDSSPQAEYRECLLKAAFVERKQPEFSLLESILYEPLDGYFLLERHLARLEDSARYFGFSFDAAKIRLLLLDACCEMFDGDYKVRLELAEDGTLSLSKEKIGTNKPAGLRVAIAREPVKSDDVFLFHKTTHRKTYSDRAISRADCDDVLLINERGELTESTIANLVVRLGGRYYTPPVDCGLLGGTFRRELLAQFKIEERVIYPDDLKNCREIFLINSVRRWMPVQLVEVPAGNTVVQAQSIGP